MPQTLQQKDDARAQAQLQYSKRLAENQASRLAKSNAAFQAQQQQYIRTHSTTGAQTLASFGLLAGIFAAILLLAHFAAQRGLARRKAQPPATEAGAPERPTIPTGQYRAAPSLLTPTEQRFHDQLRAVVGTRATIQCKVRLADLLLSGRHDLTAFRRVSQKHVDFVLCHPRSLQPLVAIELDDRSHDRPDRIARDQFVNAAYARAGMPLLHVPVSGHYDTAYLQALLQGYLATQATMPGE